MRQEDAYEEKTDCTADGSDTGTGRNSRGAGGRADLLEKDGSGLIMVGTDGRRLSYINRRIESEIPDFPKATIPSKFLNLIRKLAVGEGDFEISVNQNSISLRFGSCTISSSLIKNDFPAYKRVIPEHQSRFCTVASCGWSIRKSGFRCHLT